MRLKILEML